MPSHGSLSRWRHGFESRWGYCWKPLVLHGSRRFGIREHLIHLADISREPRDGLGWPFAKGLIPAGSGSLCRHLFAEAASGWIPARSSRHSRDPRARRIQKVEGFPSCANPAGVLLTLVRHRPPSGTPPGNLISWPRAYLRRGHDPWNPTSTPGKFGESHHSGNAAVQAMSLGADERRRVLGSWSVGLTSR